MKMSRDLLRAADAVVDEGAARSEHVGRRISPGARADEEVVVEAVAVAVVDDEATIDGW